MSWVNLLVQTGALGLLTFLIWLIPKTLEKVIEKLNETHFRYQQQAIDNAKQEREGFAYRSGAMVDELKQLRRDFPSLGEKIEKLIRAVEDQTELMKEWPSDPAKICHAQNVMQRIETLINVLIEKAVNKPPRKGHHATTHEEEN